MYASLVVSTMHNSATDINICHKFYQEIKQVLGNFRRSIHNSSTYNLLSSARPLSLTNDQ